MFHIAIKKIISEVLSDFPSQFYFQFHPFFFQANQTKVT